MKVFFLVFLSSFFPFWSVIVRRSLIGTKFFILGFKSSGHTTFMLYPAGSSVLVQVCSTVFWLDWCLIRLERQSSCTKSSSGMRASSNQLERWLQGHCSTSNVVRMLSVSYTSHTVKHRKVSRLFLTVMPTIITHSPQRLVVCLPLWCWLALALGGCCSLLLGPPATWQWCCVTPLSPKCSPNIAQFQLCCVVILL